ncbi:MAG: hypothetical protein RM338_04245 [Nostoc sp. DedQUE12a]|nr:hypothetical protein [Nostoc sp. DedQUE12a]
MAIDTCPILPHLPIPHANIIEGQSPHACFHELKAVTGLLPLNILSVGAQYFPRKSCELFFIKLSGLMTPHSTLRIYYSALNYTNLKNDCHSMDSQKADLLTISQSKIVRLSVAEV